MRRVAKATTITLLPLSVIVLILTSVQIGFDIADTLAGPPTTTGEIAKAFLKHANADNLRNLTTSLAIVIGLFFASHKLDVFREFEPHLTINQNLESRPLGDSFWLVVATATLTNKSKVLVKPTKGYCRLSKTSPFNNEEVLELYHQSEQDDDQTLEQFGWPLLKEVKREWKEGEIAIEPGEEHQETYQFIIDGTTESVIALTVTYNPAAGKPNKDAAETWKCYTFHTIPPSTPKPTN